MLRLVLTAVVLAHGVGHLVVLHVSQVVANCPAAETVGA
jgi:hypothetical protein